MSETQQCSNCSLVKSTKEFSRGSKQCKDCKCAYSQAYFKTEKGVFTQIYASQKGASTGRNHTHPPYTKSELITWLLDNGFTTIFNTWVASGYIKELRPSVDRLDSTKPYSFDNIRLVVWGVNNSAAYKERLKGERITRQNKLCLQFTLGGIYVKTYPSFAAAARENNFCRTNLGTAAKNSRPAHGFLWKSSQTTVEDIPTIRDVTYKEKACKQ